MMDHYSSQLTIPNVAREREAALQRVHVALAEASAHEYAEIWIDHNNFPALGGLIHADRGWLMLIRYDGDAGYSSRGSDEAAHSAEELDFILDNGQRDLYPLAWTLPTVDVLNALRHFAASRQVPESVRWHNDAGDSSSGPNDARFYEPE